MRLLVSAFLLSLLVGLGAGSAATAAPLTGVAIRTVDAGVSTGDLDAQMDIAKRAGAKLVRTEVPWRHAEPTASGVLDEGYLALVDHVVAGAAARGLQVELTILKTPCWASAAPADVRGDCSTESRRAAAMLYPPTDARAYGSFVGRIAQRYAGRLAAIELWNEPDHRNEAYFKGPDKARRYVALAKAAYPAIKAADPQVMVLGGAIVGADGRFLKALYREGFKGNYDALSVHYYDLVLAAMRFIRAVQREAGDTAPLWLGEFGWTSCLDRARRQGGHACVDRAAQGRFTTDVLRAVRQTPYLRGVVVFAAVDTEQSDFGLADKAYADKPILSLLRSELGRTARPRAVLLKLRRSRGRVVATGSGPAGDAYELNAFQGSTLRYRATFRLDRRGRFSLRLPAALGTRGLKVRVHQYWLGGGTVRSV